MSVVAAPPETEPRWLCDVRLRARRRMLWCRELWARHRYAGEEALAITHSEVELALIAAADLWRLEREFYATDEAARALTDELEALTHGGDLNDDRWGWLCAELGLAPVERGLLALALAAELHPAMRRVYGYLQDATGGVDATPALVGTLWRAPELARAGAASELTRWALAHPADPDADPASSATGWVADPLVLDYLLAQDGPPVLATPAVTVSPRAATRLHEAELNEIVDFVQSLAGAGAGAGTDTDANPNRPAPPALEIELIGPTGSGRTTLAARVAGRLGRGLHAVDGAALAARPNPVRDARRVARGARLAGALIVWQHAERLPAEALAAARAAGPVAFLAGEAPMATSAGAGEAAVRRAFTLAAPDRATRLGLWAATAATVATDAGPAPEPVADWALHPGEITTLSRVAPAGEDAVHDVARRLLLQAPRELLSPLPRPYTWDDLVVSPALAAHLHELESQARARSEVLDRWGLGRLTPLGRGVTALFAGPSGTGKTMAAQVLARSLRMEIYRVDLAGVVNKYIGETEKHLRAVFAACERAPVMLFFDEADALFGKRTQVNDAHDRFANIEIDYLLQRMEQFDGLAVLATNRKGDLDAAFVRRLRFTIDFAPPTVAERERLWRLALEGSVDAGGRPLVGDLDWSRLAGELDLTGAGIKAAALAAAFLARSAGTTIEVRHLFWAARRELEKQGLVLRAGWSEA